MAASDTTTLHDDPPGLDSALSWLPYLDGVATVDLAVNTQAAAKLREAQAHWRAAQRLRKDAFEMLQRLNDELCRKHGLAAIEAAKARQRVRAQARTTVPQRRSLPARAV